MCSRTPDEITASKWPSGKGSREPSALKRLMGRYATREDEVDRMLRAGLLVDLRNASGQDYAMYSVASRELADLASSSV